MRQSWVFGPGGVVVGDIVIMARPRARATVFCVVAADFHFSLVDSTCEGCNRYIIDTTGKREGGGK